MHSDWKTLSRFVGMNAKRTKKISLTRVRSGNRKRLDRLVALKMILMEQDLSPRSCHLKITSCKYVPRLMQDVDGLFGKEKRQI